MQAELLNLGTKKQQHVFEDLEANLSFAAFISHLKQLAEKSKDGKHEIFEFMLKKFLKAEQLYGPMSADNFKRFDKELFYVYNLLVPPLADEAQTFWGLGLPMSSEIFYGTNSFYDLLKQEYFEDQTCSSFVGEGAISDAKGIRLLYTLILERLYNVPHSSMDDLVYPCINSETGLPKYYGIKIDNTFVEVKPKGDLPVLDYKKIKKGDREHFDWNQFLELLPLNAFRFDGFSIISVTDVSTEQVLENIKNSIINRSGHELNTYYGDLEQSIKTLTGNPHIRFGLLPLIRLNNNPVLEPSFTYSSILFNRLQQTSADPGKIAQLIRHYLDDPKPLVYNILVETGNSDSPLIDEINQLNITSYACIPLYYNNDVIGILEVYTENGHTLDKTSLSRIRDVSSLLAQLSYDLTIEFNARIETVIKEKFTSIQPSVQWKFKEAAWEYLRHSDQTKPVMENIHFKNVYPLYGAVDIRNSTLERNQALAADLKIQLELLMQVLQDIKEVLNIAIIEEILFNCRQWLDQLDSAPIDQIQLRIRHFLEKEVNDYLTHFKSSHLKTVKIIQRYDLETMPETGMAYANRRALESSMSMINTAINGYLELLNDEIQQSYPCYFEKFRTDGIEYDIYIGQSIAPNKPFNKLYLKNVRLWQLTSMASIARITSSLIAQMLTPLETTQLIFVNGTDIDISFRMDERRFDVEGAYNIRYQVIKKRIDKVHINGTADRLTKPGKIAMVFLNDEEIREYKGYISYLQSQHILLDDLEELELEELQGVSGLKALRVGIKF